MPRGDVTARTFQDSAGGVWEVFEVHRTSRHAVAVSPGLEGGWLAFVGRDVKRRLAPFPAEWQTMPPADLERLCAKARDVSSAAATMLDERRRGPRIARPRTGLEDALDADQPDRETGRRVPPPADATSPSEIEAAVRLFTHDARERGVQAIAAMMELKAMLTQRFPNTPAARDIHRVRRWFVEAYYFERSR
jgi:hypothetical protein